MRQAFQTVRNRVAELQNTANHLKDLVQELDQQVKPVFDKHIQLTKPETDWKDIDDSLAKASKLKLAVVGQIKSGKSTLLNALLFGGRSVLPAAITPETARLTFIEYGDRPGARVKFYTNQEWEDLNRTMADLAAPQDKRKAATAIVDQAKKHLSEDQITRVLGTSKEVDLDELHDYVARQGQYTGVVRSVTLYINDPVLKGVSIADTPGTDDPVSAREKETLDFLGQVDAVIFTNTPSVRFLDSKDLRLLMTQLRGPLRSRAMVVAATKIDNLDAEQKTEFENLRNKAATKVKEFARRLEIEDQSDVMAAIDNVFQVDNIVPVSAMAFIAGRYLAGEITPSTQEKEDLDWHLNQLSEQFMVPKQPDALYEFSGIEDFQARLDQVILQHKDELRLVAIQSRLKGIAEDMATYLKQGLKQLQAKASDMREGVTQYLEKLEARQRVLKQMGEKLSGIKKAMYDYTLQLANNNLLPLVDELSIQPPTSAYPNGNLAESEIRNQVDRFIKRRFIPRFRNEISAVPQRIEDLILTHALGSVDTDGHIELEDIQNDIQQLVQTVVTGITRGLANEIVSELDIYVESKGWLSTTFNFLTHAKTEFRSEVMEETREAEDQAREMLVSLINDGVIQPLRTIPDRLKDKFADVRAAVEGEIRSIRTDKARFEAQIKALEQDAQAIQPLVKDLYPRFMEI